MQVHRILLFLSALLASSCGSSSSTTMVAPTPVRCQVQVSDANASFPPGGGSGRLAVAAARECQWSAAAQADWIAIAPPASGQGEGAVQYSVQPNAAPAARRGAIVVEGQRVEVEQAAAPCSYELERRAVELSGGASSATIGLRTHALCRWTAASDAPWLTITDREGTGPAGVRFSAAANSGAARTARLTIGGHTVDVRQAAGGVAAPDPAPEPGPSPSPPPPSPSPGPAPTPDPPPTPPPADPPAPSCEFAISPERRTVSARGDTGSVEVRTEQGCAWTASSAASWISITRGDTGSGRGDVRYSVAENTSTSARAGTVTIAGLTFTVDQEAAVAAPEEVTVTGEARQVRGTCPDLTFTVAGTRVRTNESTGFSRGNCRHVVDGVGVNVVGMREPDESLRAVRIEIHRGQ